MPEMRDDAPNTASSSPRPCRPACHHPRQMGVMLCTASHTLPVGVSSNYHDPLINQPSRHATREVEPPSRGREAMVESKRDTEGATVTYCLIFH
ncbi:hypothetical protein E2C01_090212 [Portunus trituberculatus]|uniref:Uncharacterized protein n=1 Tax=Portunus trituberculatus TaxID=210409 RepID=A0A5B7JE35_PORTR|nr:hypothetical protein [Portunus trituberculatus]